MMKSAVLAIVAVLLMANVVMYPYWTAQMDDDDWDQKDGPNGDDIVPIDALSVTVPPVRSGDILLYNYEFLAELYDFNKTNGNVTLISLEANGQLLEQIEGPLSKKDGYMVSHESWQLHTELTLSVTITMEYGNPEDNNEPLIVNGRIDVDRDRYATLRGDTAIVSSVDGLLTVDEVVGIEIPITDLEFEVSNIGYPDPHEEVDRPLEELLYGDGATLTEGENGTYGESLWGGYYTQYYNWSMDRSERVNGYDCARLNISTDIFGFLQLEKLIWLSSQVPRPVRLTYYTKLPYDDVNSSGYMMVSTAQTLTENGYTRGGAPVPIDHQAEESFVDRAPSGDFRSWEVGPQDGSISSSSFDFGLNEAVDLCFAESSGLEDWRRSHPSPLLKEAFYSANQTDVRTMEYTWNITFADDPMDWENYDNWSTYLYAYEVNVTKRVTNRIVGEDLVETFISSEGAITTGYFTIPEFYLADEFLTLASSEDIWANVQEVASVAYGGRDQDEVDFTNAWYAYSTGGLESGGGFGMELLDTLAGITIPNANVSYIMQMDNVWEGAKTTAVAVDAESGRMVYITKVTSSQALANIFGGGAPITIPGRLLR